MNENYNNLQYILEKFKILKDNWKKIRDEVLQNLNTFIEHPAGVQQTKLKKTPWSETDNYQATGWYSTAMIASGRILNNSKLYPFTTSLFDKIDLPFKQSIGFTTLKP